MKILHIVSSPRGNHSFSKRLGNAIVEKLQHTNSSPNVTTYDLTAAPFPHLEETLINSFFTPEGQRTPEMASVLWRSDQAIEDLLQADILVIDVPMHNFSIPSTLKTWVDHITRSGKTFQFSDQGPQGLVKGKKVYLAIATGGVYSEEPMRSLDFTESYLRTILGFMGMTDISAIRVEGVASVPNQENALVEAIERIAIKSS